MPLFMTLPYSGDGGGQAIPQQHTLFSELTAAFENKLDAALNWIVSGLTIGQQCCSRVQVGLRPQRSQQK